MTFNPLNARNVSGAAALGGLIPIMVVDGSIEAELVIGCSCLIVSGIAGVKHWLMPAPKRTGARGRAARAALPHPFEASIPEAQAYLSSGPPQRETRPPSLAPHPAIFATMRARRLES